MYYVMRAFAPSLHRESTDSLIFARSRSIEHVTCTCTRAHMYILHAHVRTYVRVMER